MAGLIKENFNEEIVTEISWIMTVIDDLSSKYGIETYETVLIKHRIQPEEERAIDKFFAFNVKELENMPIEKIQEKIADYFMEMTKKQWSVSDEVVKKLIEIRKKELEV